MAESTLDHYIDKSPSIWKPFFTFLLLAFICYYQTLSYTFIFDDYPGIIGNSFFRSPTPFIEIFKHATTRFITFSTFFWQLECFGPQPVPFRILNIILHAINASLIFLFVQQMLAKTTAVTIRRSVAWIAALVFLLHPLQSQPVVYIHQRFTLLVTLFALATLILTMYTHLITAGLTLLLAMFSKQNAFVIPLCLIATTWYFTPERGLMRKSITRWAPFLIIIPLSMIFFHDKEWADIGAIASSQKLSPWHYFITQGTIIWTYLKLFFIPIDQALLRETAPVFTTSTYVIGLAAWTLLAVILFVFWRFRHTHRLAFYGFFFYLLTIGLESSFVPLEDLSYEHRTYFPNVGIILILSDYLAWAWRRYSWSQQRVRNFSVLLCVALFALLTNRLSVWENPITLWSNNHETFPLNMKATLNLGIAYENSGEYSSAAIVYRNALKQEPDNSQAQLSLASALVKVESWNTAEETLRSANPIRPRDIAFHRLLLLQTQLAKKKYSDAASTFTSLMATTPEQLLTPQQEALTLRLGVVALRYAGVSADAEPVLTRYQEVTGDTAWPRLIKIFETVQSDAAEGLERYTNEYLVWQMLRSVILQDEDIFERAMRNLPDNLFHFPELQLFLACHNRNRSHAEELLNPKPPLRPLLRSSLKRSEILGMRLKVMQLRQYCAAQLLPIPLEELELDWPD